MLDLSRPLALPAVLPGARGGDVLLEADSLERVHASNVLEHVADLPGLMSTVLALLREGGEMEIEVPYERAPTAWQDPTHLRAMNENSWLYYTDWFWYLGWFEHRFELAASQWLDMNHAPASREQAAFMSVVLRKVATTPGERTLARTLQADFGGIDHDVPQDPAQAVAAAALAEPATLAVPAPAASPVRVASQAAFASPASFTPPASVASVASSAPVAPPAIRPDPVTAASISEAMSRVLVTLSK